MAKCMDVILSRRTIRRFKPDAIARDDLLELVNAGRLASSAGNRQPWEFIVVDDPGLVADVFPSLGWLAGAPEEGHQPTALIVVLLANPKDRWSAWADGGAAVQNMQLAAWEKGIGSCWIGSVDADTVGKLLKVPKELKLFSVLALGYPDETPVAEDADDVGARRDAKGVLHVQKRRLDAVCHVNRYGQRK
ncbi:MAG TPA: nitroreductase family protein [Planctomycetota bacterium]|nr:nitroreductase family protein [Planctomycetota bacterium]